MVKIGFIFGLLGLLLLANTCAAAGLTLSVVAVNGTSVEPGESISYIATVSDSEIGNPTDPSFDPMLAESVSFSINRTSQTTVWENPNWDYTFDPSTVRLENSTDSKSSTLTLQIPKDATQGTYSHKVEASARNQYDKEMNLTGRITVNVINSDVNNIPEFPSIALPAAAILGLVAIFGRKRE